MIIVSKNIDCFQRFLFPILTLLIYKKLIQQYCKYQKVVGQKLYIYIYLINFNVLPVRKIHSSLSQYASKIRIEYLHRNLKIRKVSRERESEDVSRAMALFESKKKKEK